MSKDHLSGKLAVILHADVAGSTKLVQLNEQLAHERIQDAFRRFSETIGKYHGRVQELRGDALLADFERASDAVTATLVFQADHAEYNARLKADIRPTVRVGIALGEVVIADDTVTGAGVVLAQRVEQLAEPGGLCITGAIHEALPQRMPFDQEDLGEQKVKGFDEPVRVYRVGLTPGESFPPLQQSSQLETSPKRWKLIVAVAVTAFVVAGGATYWFKPWVPQEEPASVDRVDLSISDKPSIAVMPFKNLSDDPEQAYFIDGIMGDLVTDLTKFPSLRVASRSSTTTYEGKSVDVRQVSQDLGVQYVLEASVEKTADSIRVNTQLIDATTGTQLWAQRFDRELIDLFTIRDEIRTAIVGALTGYSGPLNTAEQKRATQQSRGQLTARDFYYRAYAEFSKFDKDANEQARILLENSVALDPDDVGAHWLLAWVHWRDFWVYTNALESGKKSLEMALEEAQKSVELDRSDYRGHWVLGATLRLRGDGETAMAEYQRAFDLNPNDPDMLADWGEFLSYAGKPDLAVVQIERAMELNPFYPDFYISVLGRAYYNSRRYEDAIKMSKRVKPRIGSLEVMAASYVQLDQIEEARGEMQRMLEIKPKHSVETFIYENKSMEENLLQRFVADLRKAGLPE